MIVAPRSLRGLILAAALAATPAAQGADRIGVGLAEGDRTRAISLTGEHPLLSGLGRLGNAEIDLVVQGRIAYWWMPYEHVPGSRVWDFGIIPALRISGTGAGNRTLVAALGVGAHYLTRDAIGRERAFGEHFQFGEFLEVGLAGALHGADVLLRLEHLSNGATATPNNGVTLLGLEVRMPLPLR